jgi:cyclic pyranopterin phosphate synthase
MPHDGIAWKQKHELLSFEEIIRLSSLFISLGINKIRITGGEPLLRPDLDQLLTKLKTSEGLETLAMTTNATLLLEKLPLLKEIGLDALNISLDTLKRERFIKVTRRDNFDTVYDALLAALDFDFPVLKINVVVIAGFNEDEIIEFADLAFSKRCNVRFIEFMPFRDNDWKAENVVSWTDIKSRIETKYKLHPLVSDPSAVAKDFAVVGGLGQISFISSMTDSFCASCNRLRLTADGCLKTCLFSPAEVNLRDSLRAGADNTTLQKQILNALTGKPEAHPPAEQISQIENRTMIEIGG